MAVQVVFETILSDQIKELVTCAVLTYKNFDLITQTLESILLQNYEYIELAIFDDGSSNFPRDYIIEYVVKKNNGNIKRFVVNHFEVNQGTVKNFNCLISNTVGNFIVPCCANDSFYDKNAMHRIREVFIKMNADAVYSRHCILYKNGKQKVRPRQNFCKRMQNANKERLLNEILLYRAFLGASVSYSRKVFEKCGNFSEEYKLCEDRPFAAKAIQMGCKFVFPQYITHVYRTETGITSDMKSTVLFDDTLRFISQFTEPMQPQFSIFQKRRAGFQKERTLIYKHTQTPLSIFKKALFIIKYPDIFIERLLVDHNLR